MRWARGPDLVLRASQEGPFELSPQVEWSYASSPEVGERAPVPGVSSSDVRRKPSLGDLREHKAEQWPAQAGVWAQGHTNSQRAGTSSAALTAGSHLSEQHQARGRYLGDTCWMNYGRH